MAEVETTNAGIQWPEAGTEHPKADHALAPRTIGRAAAGYAGGGNRGALWGWSPPPRPAGTVFDRLIDRLLPRTGLPAVLFFAAMFGLLGLGQVLPTRGYLLVDGLAFLAAGGWCGLNFWRCRHAHCLVTGAGWLGLGGFAFAEAGLGRSLIGGDEQPVFLGVLVAALLFEGAWYLARGTNAVALCEGAPSTTRR